MSIFKAQLFENLNSQNNNLIDQRMNREEADLTETGLYVSLRIAKMLLFQI